MEPMCYCKQLYVPISKDVNIGCVPFDEMAGLKEIGKKLPKNPMFKKFLKCSQTYEIVGNRYECACFNGYDLKKSTGDCVLREKCDLNCNRNQLCTFDQNDKMICSCKTGRWSSFFSLKIISVQ